MIVTPNPYEIPPSEIPPGREKEINEIEVALMNNKSIALEGSMMSGKTTLLRYCSENNLGGKKGVMIDLSGLNSFDGVLNELKYTSAKKGLNGKQPKVIYVDEIGLLLRFPESERNLIIEFIQSTENKLGVCWVGAVIGSLNNVDPRLNELFPVDIHLERAVVKP